MSLNNICPVVRQVGGVLVPQPVSNSNIVPINGSQQMTMGIQFIGIDKHQLMAIPEGLNSSGPKFFCQWCGQTAYAVDWARALAPEKENA